MKNTKRIIVLISILLAVMGFAYFFGTTDQGHTFIHGLVFGHDQVYFHKGVYSNPKTISAAKINKEFLQTTSSGKQKLIPTGESVIGLPVYETPYAISQFQNKKLKYNILFLRKADQNFIVYMLQEKHG